MVYEYVTLRNLARELVEVSSYLKNVSNGNWERTRLQEIVEYVDLGLGISYPGYTVDEVGLWLPVDRYAMRVSGALDVRLNRTQINTLATLAAKPLPSKYYSQVPRQYMSSLMPMLFSYTNTSDAESLVNFYMKNIAPYALFILDLENQGLTAREQQVIAAVHEGLDNNEIADRLSISVKTVETHMDHARDKLGIRNRVKLAIWYEHQLHTGLLEYKRASDQLLELSQSFAGYMEGIPRRKQIGLEKSGLIVSTEHLLAIRDLAVDLDQHLYPKAQPLSSGEYGLRTKNLSPRQIEVLGQIFEGKNNTQIAGELGISMKTVEAHRRDIRDKTEVVGNIQLAILYDRKFGSDQVLSNVPAYIQQ